MRAIHLTLIVAAACGGRSAKPPKPPPPLDAKQLAALMYGDFTVLGDMALRLRGKCAELTAELRPHVARMKLRKADVDHMLRDAKQTAELKTELATYADRLKGLSDKIGTDLATTYLACCPRLEPVKKEPEPETKPDDAPKLASKLDACPAGYELERVLADMPTY